MAETIRRENRAFSMLCALVVVTYLGGVAILFWAVA